MPNITAYDSIPIMISPIVSIVSIILPPECNNDTIIITHREIFSKMIFVILKVTYVIGS